MAATTDDGRGLHPSDDVFPGPDLFPGAPIVRRYRDATGGGPVARAGLYLGVAAGAGWVVEKVAAVAGAAQQPRDIAALAAGGVALWWAHRAWRG